MEYATPPFSIHVSGFNTDIGPWVVAAVTDMEGMFRGAFKFDKDISAWRVGGVRYTNTPARPHARTHARARATHIAAHFTTQSAQRADYSVCAKGRLPSLRKGQITQSAQRAE